MHSLDAILTENNPLFNIWHQIKPWSGKITGLIAGFLVAGSYGAMLGILAGNIIDKLCFGWLFHPQWKAFRRSPDATRTLIIKSLYQLMGYLAKSSGYVTQQDIYFARQMMRQMRLHGQKKQLAMRSFNKGKEASFDVHQALNMASQACHHHTALKTIFTSTLLSGSKQKFLSPIIKQRLNLIFMRLGFKPPYPLHKNKAYESYVASPLSDHQILGVSPQATKEEIKKAFRNKIKKIHPDKLIAAGASEHDIKIANEETQELQAAYRRIKMQKCL